MTFCAALELHIILICRTNLKAAGHQPFTSQRMSKPINGIIRILIMWLIHLPTNCSIKL